MRDLINKPQEYRDMKTILKQKEKRKEWIGRGNTVRQMKIRK